MTIKEVFDKSENGTLTFEQFLDLTKDSKFADLSTGEYVSRRKYDDDLSSKDNQITTLNGTIKDRDKDLETLKTQLAEAGTDATKLTALTEDLTKLQTKYDDDIKTYKQQLKEQAYDFAVKEYAGTKEFSSEAAKRDFIRQLKEANLKMDGDKIMGADDFSTKYESENANAFVVKKDPEPEPEGKPKFIEPTGGGPAPKKHTLSELMRLKNENPDATISF